MNRDTATLPELRDQAVVGIEDLIGVLGLGERLGGLPADPHEIRAPFAQVGSFDAEGLSADSHRLQTAHRAVAEHLHRMPEQQQRLSQGWVSVSGERALAAVAEHQQRAESDLYVLGNLADATSAASAGVEQLLRTWYLTVSRLSTPLVGDVPLHAVPDAVATGRLPLGVVLGDIESRSALYRKTATATVEGIDEILDNLNRATDGLDVEPYPKDVPSPVPDPGPGAGAHLSPHTEPMSSMRPASADAGAVSWGGGNAAAGLTAPDSIPEGGQARPPAHMGADTSHDVPLQLSPDGPAAPTQPQAQPVSDDPGAPDGSSGDARGPGSPGRQDTVPDSRGSGAEGDLALAGDQ